MTATIRMTAADLTYAVQWEKQHHFTIEFLYNGGLGPVPGSRGRPAASGGAALGVPRHPIDVGYDVDTVANEVNEFNWFSTSKADGGSGLCQGSKATACLKPLNPQTG